METILTLYYIGGQLWMAENLKTTHYADGAPIQKVAGNANWDALADSEEAYCWYNDDSVSYAETYGALYTWPAAMNGAASSSSNPSNVQGVCPDGWHLPSDNEWKDMEMYLGMSQSDADGSGWRGTDEEGKLKEIGTAHWSSPNTGATNESGFTVLPGGSRDEGGNFYNLGSNASFWSTTAWDSDPVAWMRYLKYNGSSVGRYGGCNPRGFSVRCLKD